MHSPAGPNSINENGGVWVGVLEGGRVGRERIGREGGREGERE